MSHAFYNELWFTTQTETSKLLALDNQFQNNNVPRAEGVALNDLLPIYLRYRNIVNRLIVCYDHTVQCQKRELIKRLLNCCIGRMLEYRREIVKLNCSEYEWPDDLLIKMKWTPDDIVVTTPSSYVSDRQDQLNERRKIIGDLIKMAEDQLVEKVDSNLSNLQRDVKPSLIKVDQTLPMLDNQHGKITGTFGVNVMMQKSQSAIDLEDGDDATTKEEAFERAILMIQSHERARVDRKRAIELEFKREYNLKSMLGEIEFKNVTIKDMFKAALTIQRYWRGYEARKKWKNRLNKVEELMGMTISSWQDDSMLRKNEENLQRIQKIQAEASNRMKEIVENEKKIPQNKREERMEDITDEITEWFRYWYNEVGYFGVYPSANEGGSALITSENILTPQEFHAHLLETMKDKKKKGAEGDLPPEKTKKVEKKTKTTDSNWVMPKSKVLEALAEVNREFFSNWGAKDDSSNLNLNPDVNSIKENVYCDLHLEMRKIVDDTMRLELKKLNAALIKDHKKDKEKFKIPVLTKGKQKGKKKRKAKVDTTASDNEVEEAFIELVHARIIRNYTEVKLNQWIGDISYQNHEAKTQNKNYQHQLGDIKQAIIDYCILPLGSNDAHSVAPLVRSVCIAGLPLSGKKFLANAICTEIGALLFDLKPSHLVDQYDGKANENRLMKLIKLVAKAYPPAVVLVDDGDKPWWKKISPADKPVQQKKFAKWMTKFMKLIKPGDQMLVLGLASSPWKSNNRFYKIYDKFIILPLSDYNSLYLFYNHVLMKYHGIDRNIDISSLAKSTIGYPLGVIHEAIENVLNIKRRMTLKFQPLCGEEILTELMKWVSPFQKDIKQFERFESKTPLGKKRIKMMKKKDD